MVSRNNDSVNRERWPHMPVSLAWLGIIEFNADFSRIAFDDGNGRWCGMWHCVGG